MGDDNDIREYVSIHLSSMLQWTTRLGDGNLIMGGCHVAHDCILGNRVILANGTLLAGHVIVDDMVGLCVPSLRLAFFNTYIYIYMYVCMYMRRYIRAEQLPCTSFAKLVPWLSLLVERW